jgi:hypothetical protein
MLRALSILLAAFAISAGCASSAPSATVIRTLYNPAQEGFDNILVISVAGEYASRRAFERQVVMELSRMGASATAYYTVIGRNPQFTRSYIHDAIRSRGFDALIFTRLKGQEQEALAPLRPVGTAFDLFGYDYGELNRDVRIQEARAITFITEVYDAQAQLKVWSIETLSTDITTLEALITEQALTVSEQLREDGLFNR